MSTCDRIVGYIRESSANRRTVESNDSGSFSNFFLCTVRRHGPRTEP